MRCRLMREIRPCRGTRPSLRPVPQRGRGHGARHDAWTRRPGVVRAPYLQPGSRGCGHGPGRRRRRAPRDRSRLRTPPCRRAGPDRRDRCSVSVPDAGIIRPQCVREPFRLPGGLDSRHLAVADARCDRRLGRQHRDGRHRVGRHRDRRHIDVPGDRHRHRDPPAAHLGFDAATGTCDAATHQGPGNAGTGDARPRHARADARADARPGHAGADASAA